MSYILDALKKSDQERQQGNSPSLYAVHSVTPPDRNFSSFKQQGRFRFIVTGVLVSCICLGLFFFLTRQHLSSPPPSPPKTLEADVATTLTEPAKQVPDKNEAFQPVVIIKEQKNILRPAAVKDTVASPQTVMETEVSPKSLPMLQDLPANIRTEMPNLKFAGHTYSENPSQRMIIVNGHILREGNTIAPYTHLSEITWDGVVIDYKGTQFLVKTN